MRRTRLLAVGLLTAAVVVTVIEAKPAGANKEAALTVTSGKTVAAAYPRLVGNYVGNQQNVATPVPTDCDNPTPYCAWVPVTIEVPRNVGPADTVLVTLAISWDDPTGANDLDTYLYDDQQQKAGQYKT